MASTDTAEVQAIMDSEESISWKVDELLGLNLSKKQIMGLGFNESTVRQRLNKRKEKGLPVAGSAEPGTDLIQPRYSPIILKGTEHISPAWMAQRLAYVIDGNEKMQAFIEFLLMYPLYQEDLMTQVFRRNLMAVTAIKGDQTKELIEQMRLGAQQAADAAHDAAVETAGLMVAGQKDAAIAGSANPMQARMMDLMWPMVSNIFGKVTGGLMGGGKALPQAPATPAGETPAPSGWTRRSEKKVEEPEGDSFSEMKGKLKMEG